MSRVYGEKLLYIECDGCDARLTPGPEVVNSGWKKFGWMDLHTREKCEQVLCPQCAYDRERR
jgi:hypothetical protein